MSAPEILGVITATDDGQASLTFERHYVTDPADLWQAITDPQRLARWFAPVSGVLQPGGRFTIHFDDGEVSECEVLSCEAPTSFTWRWPHEGHDSHIEVKLTATAEGTDLRLVHTRLAVAQASGYGAGWQSHVRGLEAYLAGDSGGDWWAEFDRVRAGYAAALAGN